MDIIGSFIVGVIFATILLTVTLTPDVNSSQIKWAEGVCEANGGIARIEDWYGDSSGKFVYAFCKNGAEFGMSKEDKKQYEQK